MDMLPLLRRCEAIETGAARLYRALSRRFPQDGELARFFTELAADERGHAKKLGTWRRFLEYRDPSRRPSATGYEESVAELEALLLRLRERVHGVSSAEDALRLALELESSELDAIYSTILQSSPLARFADVQETRKAELGAHHQKLLRMVRARCGREADLLAAALLDAEDDPSHR
jgi:rubrerythrin